MGGNLFTFWEALISGDVPKYWLIICLTFLITEKLCQRLSCFTITNFVTKLYFKSYIKFKNNYQRSLNYSNTMSHINVDFLSNNVKGMQLTN